MTIPIWDLRSGQISKARAEATSARHQLNAQRLSFSESLEATYQLYQIAMPRLVALIHRAEVKAPLLAEKAEKNEGF